MESQVQPELLGKVDGIVVAAECAFIRDQRTYESGARFLTETIVPLRKEIEATFGPMKEKAWAAHKEIVAQEKKHLEPVQRAEQLVKGKLGKYVQEQEEIRRTEQARLDEEERIRAEEEALANAIEAEAAGAQPEEVQAVLEQPVVPTVVIAPPAVQKVQGVAAVTRYSVGERVDILKLMYFVIANPHMIGSCILPNMQGLNALARTQKELFDIPGVKLVKETGISARGR